MKKLNPCGWIISISLFIFACGNQLPKNPNHIRVGICTGLEQEIAEAAKQEAKEKFGLDVELITFSDYVMPNEALANGEIDANAFQHIPYLEEQSRQRGYDLAVVGQTFLYPIVGYSKKIKTISELKNGDGIAIPNDPTNGGRALLLLEKYGLIKLSGHESLLPKVTDIAENPKGLRILEIEAPQLPAVLDDNQVVIAIINNNFAALASLDPEKLGVMQEEKDSPYVNVIVSRKDNKDSEEVKKFVLAYQSHAVERAAERAFQGRAIKGW